MNKKSKLLILYDWFYPGFRAGGPIQSLTNLIVTLMPEFEIFVITGAFDLNSKVAYDGVIMNGWNDVRLPNTEGLIKVFYAEKKRLDKSAFSRLLRNITPDVIYLNGIFSYSFFMLPLLALKKINKKIKVVVCPRGMLKKGALSGKFFKKKVYVNILRFSGLLNQVFWHATTNEESKDIQHHFPVNKGILVASNIPKSPYRNVSFFNKKAGQLKLVYLSLINEHKNLMLLIQVIQQIKAEISLDIYGPIVDEAYWKRCEDLLTQSGKVQYKGQVEPGKVQEVMSQYHALILFTKGENFGHAIYESLSVGRPVIISNYTPWQNLYEKNAGANVKIEAPESCIEKIKEFAAMEQIEYNHFCLGAFTVAKNYYTSLDAKEKYSQLFSAS